MVVVSARAMVSGKQASSGSVTRPAPPRKRSTTTTGPTVAGRARRSVLVQARSRFAALIQRLLAVVEQAEVDELLFEARGVGPLQRLAQLVEQELREALAGPPQRLADPVGLDRFAALDGEA